jgi:hypothetical protein
MAGKQVQAWTRLLLERGYRLDQLIVDEPTQDVSCSVEDLPAAARLVQNPDKIDLMRPEILQDIRECLLNGRLPHHLVAGFRGTLYYDTDEVTNDCDAVALGRYDEKSS